MPPRPRMTRRAMPPPTSPVRTRDTTLDAAPAPRPLPSGAIRTTVRSTPAPVSAAPGAPRYVTAAPAAGATDRAVPETAVSPAASAAPTAGPARAAASGGARVERLARVEAVDTRDPYAISLDDVAAADPESAMAPLEVPASEHATVLELPDVPPADIDWTAPTQLAADALVLPAVPKSPDDGKKTTAPAPEAEALAVARQGYASLVSAASRAQGEFARAAQRTGEAMAGIYQDEAARILERFEESAGVVDVQRQGALAELDRNAAAADGALEIAFRNTIGAAELASRRAHGRIAANYQRADGQINTILGGLVAGHVRSFDAAVTGIGQNQLAANAQIDAWVSGRAANYPTTAGRFAGAKNEERQRRIPGVANHEKEQMGVHKDRTVAAWTRAKNHSVTSIQCGYRCPLDQHKQAINEQGHAAVARALREAMRTLREQTREGRRVIAQTRAAGRGQIDALARAAAERLNGETRGALAGAQRETAAAQRGVQQAAESAGAAYPRLARRLEDLLARAAQRGPQALAQVARQAPAELLRSVEAMRGTNAERLAANGGRLRRGLAERRAGVERSLDEQTVQSDLTLAQAVRESGPTLETAGEGFSNGFAEIARQVLRASDSWAEPFETHFAALLRSARRDVGRQLESLLSGPEEGEGNADPNAAGHEAAAAAVAGAAAGAGAAAAPPAPAADPSCAPCEIASAEEVDARASVAQVSGWPALPGGADPAADAAPSTAAPTPGTVAAAAAAASAAVAAGTAAGGAEGAAPERPRGLLGQREFEAAFFEERGNAQTFFEPHLAGIDTELETQLMAKIHTIEHGFEAGFWDPVDEGAITGALHNLTQLLGAAIEELWVTNPPVHAVPLREDLQRHIDPLRFGDNDDLNACYAYLDGHAEEGAAFELKASIGFFNDDEARIESTMGALTPAQLANLSRDHGATLDNIAGYLGGTDLRVFDALRQGDYALAGALRLRDSVDDARRDGDNDAANAALTTNARGTRYSGWTRDMEDRGIEPQDQAAEARRSVVDALGGLVARDNPAFAAGVEVTEGASEHDRNTALAVAYVTRPIDVEVGGGDMPPTTITLRMEGANRDLAEALLRSGDRSVESRAARLGVEMQRTGDEPRPINVDDAVFDPRFRRLTPDMSREERLHVLGEIAEARREREEMIRLAATRYGGADETRTTAAMTDMIAEQLAGRMEDFRGAALVRGLVHEERPSANTMAMAMRHGMYSHVGTNEDLLFHFTERMDRDEIAAMRQAFAAQTVSSEHPNGLSLDAELGVFGEGSWGELSGDDALRMERAMLGQPRNDRERFESAMFAIQQQRRETGGFGASLASGSYAERAMLATEARLLRSVGGEARFNRRGELIGGGAVEMFGPRGAYTGTRRADFMVASGVAEQVAQNYSARIDAIANGFTMIIAVIGAIVAAAVSVLTLGAASPLLMASIAAISGLAAMGLNYAIKGGRYGWEQALTDLGMTAVQALTAGIGASLGASAKAAQDAARAAERGVEAALKAREALTGIARVMSGNPVVNQIAIGAVTGGIGGLGNTMLDEHTWEGGVGDILGNIVAGTARGTLGGAATGAVTGAIDNFKIGSGSIGDRMQALTASGGILRGGANIAARGLARGTIAGLGGVAGRATEVGFDALTGRFRGDAGDAMLQIRDAGVHSFLQGIGEGMTESVAGRFAPPHGHGEPEEPRVLTESERQAVARARMGEPVDPSVRPLVAADAMGLPPAAGHAMAEAAEAPGARRATRAGEVDERAPARRPGAATSEDESGGTARSGPGSEGGGGDDGGPPRARSGSGGGDDDDRLFPNLTHAEVDAAIGEARGGPGVRVGVEQPGADTRPLPAPAEGEATLPQRQRAGALHDEASALSRRASGMHAEAEAMENRARTADATGRPERAERLRNRAAALRDEAGHVEAQAGARRAEAAEFASGRRSATADLPGPEDVDTMLANLRSEEPGLLHIGLSQLEAHPELLPRLLRSMLSGESGGRLVFRVESERSRSLVRIDAAGNIHFDGDASIHVNAGSFERAIEFVLNNSAGRARIYSFEVDESWVRAVRSAAIPEPGTAALAGQPRLVDVRFAGDQLEIPPRLLNEFNRMIVPGSGRVHEIEVPGRAPGGGGGAPEETPATRVLRGEPPEHFGTTDQAAAGIRGSRLQGDAAQEFGVQGTTLNRAVNTAEELGAPGGALEGRIRPASPDAVDRFIIPARNPGDPDIPVRIVVVDELPRVNGEMQAARYDTDPDVPGGRIISIARGTPATEVARALAHEIGEIRALRPGSAAMPDAFGAGGRGGPLSPHDEGRLGEIELMARQLGRLDPAHPDTPATRRRIMDEAQRLAEHMGLLGDTDASTRRLGAARRALPEDSPMRALLDEAVRSAADNPFLQRSTGAFESDLALLARRLEHARSLGDSGRALALREQAVLDQAVTAVMRDRLVVTRMRGGRVTPETDPMRIEALRARLSPAERALLDRAIATAKSRPPLTVTDTRPTPGYEARFLTDSVPHAPSALPDDLPIPVRGGPDGVRSMRVDEAVAQRQDLIERQSALRADLASEPDPTRRVAIQAEINGLIAPINHLSEALGMAAGRQFIANDPELRLGRIVAMPHSGAGVPDLLVELPNGRLVMVECKGGDAELGTRASADRRSRVQQGNRAYLESLAATLEGNPATRDIGVRMRAQLAEGDDFRYVLVRQPFDLDGERTTPEISEFDTRRR